MSAHALADLLTEHREVVVRYFAGKGKSVRRYESPEDLAQGVHLHALQQEHRFDYQGERQFVAWVLRLARQHLRDRIAHWKALKRDAGPVLRITYTEATRAGVNPPAQITGPITNASRKEQLHLATLAMDGLPPRDREIVRLMTAGADIEGISRQLKISSSAAQRARLRALERFRKIYDIVRRQGG